MNIHSTSRCASISSLAKLVLALCLTACHAQHLTLHRGCGEEDLVCLVFKRIATYQLVDQKSFKVVETYECQPLNSGDDMTYDLSLPKQFIDSNPNLDQGLTVSINGGCIQGTTVTYPPNATITVLPKQRRLRGQKASKGNVTMLVVRATERGYPELRSTEKIREMIFDNITGSLARQMNDCSFNKFNILKAKGPGINDGVLELDLDIDVFDMYNRDVERLHLVPSVAPYGGEDAFDHVIYCIPYGTRAGKDGNGTRNWLAYALMDHPRSVFNHFWCGLLSGSMHEVGHNLGLQHAGQDDWVYGDATGLMGYSTYQEFGPRSCYNAKKNWQLGWYEDRSLDLSSRIRHSSWGGRLVAFVDYEATPQDEAVIIKVGNLFMQYNRARDFNQGTREYANRVVIVSIPTTGSSFSNLEAALANNIAVSTFAYPNFDGNGHDLIFKVCDQVQGPRADYVHLSIHLGNGVQSPTCAQPLPALTHAPTISPTTASPQPSRSPTGSPRSSPSSAPSASPTIRRLRLA